MLVALTLPHCCTVAYVVPAVLLQALDAAIRRHDPHALDALLMQFAAVIVSTTGAEVDRMEREIMVRAKKHMQCSLSGCRLIAAGSLAFVLACLRLYWNDP